MIKIEGLSKFFRTEEVETIALNKVSLNILKRMNISHRAAHFPQQPF